MSQALLGDSSAEGSPTEMRDLRPDSLSTAKHPLTAKKQPTASAAAASSSSSSSSSSAVAAAPAANTAASTTSATKSATTASPAADCSSPVQAAVHVSFSGDRPGSSTSSSARLGTGEGGCCKKDEEEEEEEIDDVERWHRLQRLRHPGCCLFPGVRQLSTSSSRRNSLPDPVSFELPGDSRTVDGLNSAAARAQSQRQLLVDANAAAGGAGAVVRPTCRHRVWQFLNNDQEASAGIRTMCKVCHAFMVIFILALFISDDRTEAGEEKQIFDILERAAVVLFGLEYILRLYACVEQSDHTRASSHLWVRVEYAFTVVMILDLISVVALGLDVLSQAMKTPWKGLGALRFVRLVNILRVERTFRFVTPLFEVVRQKRQELVATLGLAFFLLLISSSMMYYIEFEENDLFTGLPSAMWWATTALTTVGYGDIYPITPAGRIVGSFVAFMGVGLFALPAGVIASGFQERWEKTNEDEGGDDYWQNRIERRLDYLYEEVKGLKDCQQKLLRLLEAQYGQAPPPPKRILKATRAQSFPTPSSTHPMTMAAAR